MTNPPLLLDLTNAEQEAWTHAAMRVRIDGAHKVTGCPRYCRAMCRYEITIRAMEARGIEVPS